MPSRGLNATSHRIITQGKTEQGMLVEGTEAVRLP